MSNRDDRLAIDTSDDEAGVVVSIVGEIDMHSSPQLRAALLEALERKPARVIVDLKGVEYMDSSGVGTVVEAKRRAEQAGGRLVLAGLRPRVRSLFEITQLDRFFTIAETVEDARQA